MKKILIALIILIAFASGGLTNYYCNKKPVAKTEIFVIDKTNFDTYSKTLLKAISKCVKEEKRLDIKAEHDLQIYIGSYHNGDFSPNLTKKQKYIADDVWLTSLNLMYLLEAIQDNNKKDIKIQHKILTDLLMPYKL